MTDRSTDNPEDQPVPLDPDAAPAADSAAPADESVAPEQEAIAEVAAAMGVEAPREAHDAAELAEAPETDDGDDLVDDVPATGDEAETRVEEPEAGIEEAGGE